MMVELSIPACSIQNLFFPTFVLEKSFKKPSKILFLSRKTFPAFGSGKQVKPLSLKTSYNAKIYRKKSQLHFKLATCTRADCRMFIPTP